MTEMLERAIAAPATIGGKGIMIAGYSTPAAIGTAVNPNNVSDPDLQCLNKIHCKVFSYLQCCIRMPIQS